jgi:adenylosuccinate lyase
VLDEDAVVRAYLGARDLDRLLDPRHYTGLAQQFIDRVLASRSGPH